jgi:hypothetical protein
MTEPPERLRPAMAEARAMLHVGYPWWLRPFLAADVIAITLGRHIFLREAMTGAKLEKLLRHELVHVQQGNRHTLPGFLIRYGLEFVRHWWRVRDVNKAYRLISFEVEAWAAEEESL